VAHDLGSHRVWFFPFPDAELLDLTGPWAVLGQANDVLGRPAYVPQLVTAAGGTLRGGHGLRLSGTRSLARMARQPLPDTAVFAGGPRGATGRPPDEAVVRWLRGHHHRIPRVVSICAGAFVLGQAGLLDGRCATTHWRFLADLKQAVPRAHVVDDQIYVHDGPVWTSAGITAGIDLMLAVVEEDHGHAVAMAVARNLVLFLRRSGGQAQFSAAPQRQGAQPSDGPDLAVFIVEHIDQDLGVERLARHMAMSPRTLARWCRDRHQESPAALVRALRVDEARRLLAETTLPLKAISARAGLGDPATLWRVFTKQIGVTPAEYRDRFAARSPRRTARTASTAARAHPRGLRA